MDLEVGRKRAPSSFQAIGRQVPQLRAACAGAVIVARRADHGNRPAAAGKGGAFSFLNKAETLLTRHWAGANWQAREEILRSVKWLLNLVRLPSAWPVPKVRTRKSSKRHRRVP
jgi:hypothetical protein